MQRHALWFPAIDAIIGGALLLWRTGVFRLLLWLLPILAAANPVVITLTGGAGPVDLPVEVRDGEQITITARSLAADPIDVTLELLRDDRRVAFNDDHSTDIAGLASLDAAIVDFVPPAAGTYTLRIDSFNGAQSGDVEVSVQSSPLVPPCDTPRQRVHVAANQISACWLQLDAGTALTISARDVSGTLDPVVALLDANSTVLASNDDHGSADLTLNVLDAKIAGYVVPADGEYTIQVRDFGSAAGVVEIVIEQAEAATS